MIHLGFVALCSLSISICVKFYVIPTISKYDLDVMDLDLIEFFFNLLPNFSILCFLIIESTFDIPDGEYKSKHILKMDNNAEDAGSSNTGGGRNSNTGGSRNSNTGGSRNNNAGASNERNVENRDRRSRSPDNIDDETRHRRYRTPDNINDENRRRRYSPDNMDEENIRNSRSASTENASNSHSSSPENISENDLSRSPSPSPLVREAPGMLMDTVFRQLNLERGNIPFNISTQEGRMRTTLSRRLYGIFERERQERLVNAENHDERLVAELDNGRRFVLLQEWVRGMHRRPHLTELRGVPDQRWLNSLLTDVEGHMGDGSSSSASTENASNSRSSSPDSASEENAPSRNS